MKIEMHCHTGGTSGCAQVDAEQIAEIYANAGYGALIITNHLSQDSKNYMKEIADRAVADKLIRAFRTVRMLGEPLGLKVWLGMEVTLMLNGYPTDMLLYGIDERFIYDNAKMYNYNPKQLLDAVRDIGGMVYQAHPFRSFPPPNLVSPKEIDGIESYNGNPRHFCNYLLAREYALEHNLRQISGGDYHELGDENRGGIIVPDNIATPTQLIAYLKSNKPRLCYAESGTNAFKEGNNMEIL